MAPLQVKYMANPKRTAADTAITVRYMRSEKKLRPLPIVVDTTLYQPKSANWCPIKKASIPAIPAFCEWARKPSPIVAHHTTQYGFAMLRNAPWAMIFPLFFSFSACQFNFKFGTSRIMPMPIQASIAAPAKDTAIKKMSCFNRGASPNNRRITTAASKIAWPVIKRGPAIGPRFTLWLMVPVRSGPGIIAPESATANDPAATVINVIL